MDEKTVSMKMLNTIMETHLEEIAWLSVEVDENECQGPSGKAELDLQDE
jgi:hypothetical protein